MDIGSKFREFAELRYEALVNEAVSDFKKFPKECRLLNNGLQDFWEEFKYQMQRDESVHFEVYEETIHTYCRSTVETLKDDDLSVLWTGTDEYFYKADEVPPFPTGAETHDAIEEEFYTRICNRANDEPLLHDPDEERDRARFEEDQRIFMENQPQAAASPSEPQSLKEWVQNLPPGGKFRVILPEVRKPDGSVLPQQVIEEDATAARSVHGSERRPLPKVRNEVDAALRDIDDGDLDAAVERLERLRDELDGA